MRKAKIVGTLGPTSNSVDIIEKLILAGLNVARVNMSHGTHESHAQLIQNIRTASKNVGQEVAILIDLQGPKIRVDKLPQNLILKGGDEWVIGASSIREQYIKDYPEFKDRYIPTIYEKLVDDCHDGARILFDDGLLTAEAVERVGNAYRIKVLVGGELKSNKGINLPDCEVSAPAFTEKDRADLLFALRYDIDYIALSFVRKPQDIIEVKTLLHDLKMIVPIVSKIEKPQAVENLKSIIEVTDVIMVARGDMGVEVGNHLVPSIQKKIITMCNENKIPVITATQMLESMTENPTPTRAEASDVANAIWDGTDAVMLSGETASGKYPVMAIKMMDQIIEEAEKTPKERPLLRHIDLSSVNASVMVAASMVAEKVHAKYILAFTESGQSCMKASMFRPHTPVLGVTNSLASARKICLYWGVSSFLVHDFNEDNPHLQQEVLARVKTEKGLSNGDKLVITRGDGKFFNTGSSNSLKVEILHETSKILGSSEAMEAAEDHSKTIHLDTNICASCQNCVQVCPHDIWVTTKDDKKRTTIDHNKIVHCQLDMICVQKCPTGAIEIIPKEFTEA